MILISISSPTSSFRESLKARRWPPRIKVAQGTIEIDRLTIDNFAGTSLSTSGTLRDLTTHPSGRLSGELKAVNLDGIASIIARLLPDQPVADWFRDAQASLSPADVAFSLQGGGANGGLSGSLEGMLGGGNIVLEWQARWDIFGLGVTHSRTQRARIDNPDGQKLFGLVGTWKQSCCDAWRLRPGLHWPGFLKPAQRSISR